MRQMPRYGNDLAHELKFVANFGWFMVHKLKLHTHWNSTYTMILCLVQQKSMMQDIIFSMTILQEKEELSISSNHYLTLSPMVHVLKS